MLAGANFPAQSAGRRVIRLDDCKLPRLLTAVLRVLPIDQIEPDPAVGMEVVGDRVRREPIHVDIERLLTGARHSRRWTDTARRSQLVVSIVCVRSAADSGAIGFELWPSPASTRSLAVLASDKRAAVPNPSPFKDASKGY